MNNEHIFVPNRSVIDLFELPLEITQRVELQLLKNTNEARLLMYLTLTGLTTTSRSPTLKMFEANYRSPQPALEGILSSDRSNIVPNISEHGSVISECAASVSALSVSSPPPTPKPINLVQLPPNFNEMLSTHYVSTFSIKSITTLSKYILLPYKPYGIFFNLFLHSFKLRYERECPKTSVVLKLSFDFFTTHQKENL